MFSLNRFYYRRVALSDDDPVSVTPSAQCPDLEKSRPLPEYAVVAPDQSRKSWWRSQAMKPLFLIFGFYVAYFYGPSVISKIRTGCRYDQKPATYLPILGNLSSDVLDGWAQPPTNAARVPIGNLKPQCSSGGDVNCKKLMDGIRTTAWQSDETTAAGPHTVLVDLLKEYHVTSVILQTAPNVDKPRGVPTKHVIEVSTNKVQWTMVATGTWRPDTDNSRYANFEPLPAQYVRLTVFGTSRGEKFATINELVIMHIPPASLKPAVSKGGKWGITLSFPIVPVSAFINPLNGELVTLSSFAPDKYEGTPGKDRSFTRSATWNPKTGVVAERNVSETGHDMFCPGTSFDKDGRVLVTGGTNPLAFSVFDPNASEAGKWKNPGGKFQLSRGYAGQTYLADGRTFMIGGTWGQAGNDKNPDKSGSPDSKDGEVYDPVADKWDLLSNIKGDSIKMNESWACQHGEPWSGECVKTEWQQHHPWLFSWKNNSIFHAGPSKKMHWFFPTLPKGRTEDAGTRSNDEDAVCGVTSLYDAEAGFLLTSGGARNYHYWVGDPSLEGPKRYNSTTNAIEVELGVPGMPVTTRNVKPMKYQRIFANGVILPTGETLVVGGQTQGEPFWEETWHDTPEIYTPGKEAAADPWRKAARHSIPRVYHSWGLLTVNATVIVGGGGLSGGRPQTSRFDAQLYEPPYLFDGDRRVTQPVITNKNASRFTIKDTVAARTIKVTTDTVITGASLMRYSAVTHTLNNDMRRIKLTPQSVPGEAKTYTFEIPNEPGVTLPGYWMLFVLAGGVPSRAETVQIITKS